MEYVFLKLERHFEEPSGLVGGVLVFGNDSVFTIEKAGKMIMPGRYFITCTWSPKFSHALPYKKYLDGRVPILTNKSLSASRGIRIHCGNTLADTSGCVLVGSNYRFDDKLECIGVEKSGAAYSRLCEWMSQYYKKHFFVIDIEDTSLPF